MRRPLRNLGETGGRRVLVAARVFVPANRVGAWMRVLQEGQQVVVNVLVADGADKLAVARQALKLRNECVPPLCVARDGDAVPVVLVAEFVVDQAVPKDLV